MQSYKHLLSLILCTLLFAPPFLHANESTENPASPVIIKHMVVFGNASSDTGNTRELFDELSGRKKPSRLREDIRFYGPDAIDIGSSLLLSAAIMGGARYMHWDTFLDKLPVVKNYGVLSRLAGLSILSNALYHSSLAHWVSQPFDLLVDRSQLLLNAILWLYPGIGLPVLPPGQLYDVGGRFTNGTRVWSELLAQNMGLDPDDSSQFVSLAYAGSHIRRRTNEQEALSLNNWITYIDIGKGVASTLMDKNLRTTDKNFLESTAKNMSKDGRCRFENMLKIGVPPSFAHMVEDFGLKANQSGEKSPESTLYLLAYGSDDYLIDGAEPAEVIESLKESLTTLITQNQARHILIKQLSPMNMPAMMQLPGTRQQHMQTLIADHNTRLQALLSEIKKQFDQVKITAFTDTHHLAEQAKKEHLCMQPCLKLPEHEGQAMPDHTMIQVPVLNPATSLTKAITSDGSSLNAVYRFIGKPVAQCNNPEKHLFYDDVNLTNKGHHIVAEMVCRVLNDNGYKCHNRTEITSHEVMQPFL